ncbi:MAG: dethiobiotin synthase [Xanthobacteraceae bacterium]
MSAVFITATGTDIGKTFVATGLIRHLRAVNRSVSAIKPVVSGFAAGAWSDSDPALLLAALGQPLRIEEVERISPWRFIAPLSPHTAARQEGRCIPFAELVEFCRRSMAQTRGTLLIEGIGGVMVPLDEHHTVLDVAAVLRIPIILVAGSYVGTLSHTFTALEVLARRNLDIAALVVSESAASAASLEDTVATLEHFAAPLDVISIPLLQGEQDHPSFARIAALI